MKAIQYLTIIVSMMILCTVSAGCIIADDSEKNECQDKYEYYLKIIGTKPNEYKILTGDVDFDDYYVDNQLFFFKCWTDQPYQEINSILGFGSSETFDIEGGVMLDTFSTAFLIKDSTLKQSYLVQISKRGGVEADIFYLTPDDYDYVLWIIGYNFGDKQKTFDKWLQIIDEPSDIYTVQSNRVLFTNIVDVLLYTMVAEVNGWEIVGTIPEDIDTYLFQIAYLDTENQCYNINVEIYDSALSFLDGGVQLGTEIPIYIVEDKSLERSIVKIITSKISNNPVCIFLHRTTDAYAEQINTLVDWSNEY